MAEDYYNDNGDIIYSYIPVTDTSTITVGDSTIKTSDLTFTTADSSGVFNVSPWTTNAAYGDVEIQGDLKLNGKSIGETLERIERALKIPPELVEDPERLEMHAKLKKLYDEYQDLSEKLKTWERLAGTRDD